MNILVTTKLEGNHKHLGVTVRYVKGILEVVRDKTVVAQYNFGDWASWKEVKDEK